MPETEVVLSEGEHVFLKKTNNTLDIVVQLDYGWCKSDGYNYCYVHRLLLIDIFNKILANVVINDVQLSIQYLLGIVFAPVTWLMGISWEEATITGELLSTKLITNKLVAYQEFVEVGSNLSSSTTLLK